MSEVIIGFDAAAPVPVFMIRNGDGTVSYAFPGQWAQQALGLTETVTQLESESPIFYKLVRASMRNRVIQDIHDLVVARRSSTFQPFRRDIQW